MRKYTYEDVHCPLDKLPPYLRAVNPVCLDILYKRGISTPEQIAEFLHPSLAENMRKRPPLLDMDKAVRILGQAAKQKMSVTVYHDYDADGITAASVAADCLGHLGIPVNLYCNSRIHGGFGINANGVDELMERYPDTKVLLTVDNGITGIEGVARAKSKGLQVIVTDHHEPNGILPIADAVIDHKRKDELENQDRNCCGAGVIWKVMMALYIAIGHDVTHVMNTLDIVALGTIADVVPLLGDNRAMVQEGLKRINDGVRPFFRAFSDVMELQTIDSQTIAFKMAPMINAVSRMNYDTQQVVRLMLCQDMGELRDGIGKLASINEERKKETEREVSLAADAMKGQKDGDKAAIVFCDDSFQEGIVGIVAGQLKEAYHVPCAVFARDKNGNWKGSARSPEGFHLKDALDKCAEYLLAYGGHAKAAGLTVRSTDFDNFKKKFEELAKEKMGQAGYVETTAIDEVLPAEKFTESLVRELRALEPFGEGFRPLLFGVKASIVETRYMGQNKQHVKYLDDSGLSVIQWNKGEEARRRNKAPAKFVGYPALNCWNGTTSVQFIAE